MRGKISSLAEKDIAKALVFRFNLAMKSICTSIILLALMILACSGLVRAEQSHAEPWDVLAGDLSQGWFTPPVHCHFSPRGTPMVHPFRVEPAFTQRDLLVDYSFRSGAEADEHEIEAELEWAFSRRFALIVEVPYIFINPDDERSVDGFGDLAVAPRFRLAEYERFMLAFGLEIETSTGDDDRDLGRGEEALGPSFSAWFDLGHWWTLDAQLGTEHGVDSGDSELIFRAALIHTFGSGDAHDSAHDEHDHDSDHGLPPGLLSLILEVDGTLGLSGDEDGETEAEGLIGAYYGLSEHMDLRAGYLFPLSSSHDLNSGLTAGAIWHF